MFTFLNKFIKKLSTIKTRGLYRMGTRQGQDADWIGSSVSSRSAAQQDRSTLLSRARDLAENNQFGIQSVRKFGTNLIGKGIIPTVYSSNEVESDIIDQQWASWGKYADFYEIENIQSLFRIIVQTVFVSGSCFILRRYTNRQSPLRLSLQLLEPEYLYNLLDNVNFKGNAIDGYIENGIQYDKYGRVDGYWLHKEHPGNVLRKTDMLPVYVPKKDCLLVSWAMRPETLMAPSWFNPVGNMMNDVEEYAYSDLVKRKISSCFSAFIRDPLDSPTDTEGDEELDKIIPGRIQVLPGGKDITFPNPPADNNQDYMKSRKKDIASGLGITYETLTSDYQDVNFSSARIARDEQDLFYEQLQSHMVIPKICQPVFDWFLEELASRGLISDKNVTVNWTVPVKPFIQPVQEISALESKLRLGMITPSEAVRAMGKDPEKHWAQIEADLKWLESHGLSVVHLPGVKENKESESEDVNKYKSEKY